jgi:hypothetical protein
MSSRKGTKRARTDQPQHGPAVDLPIGREQLLLVSPELQSRCGKRYCNEAELLPLLLSQGFVRRVRTIVVSVHPVGGEIFSVTLDAALPTVGEAKAEIARVQGTKEDVQELYKVETRADGKAVREDDADPEYLDDDNQSLGDGELVAMAVKEAPLIWRTYSEKYVLLREEGALVASNSSSLVTSGIELTEGRHYWEVEVVVGPIRIGVTRPNLDDDNCTDGWYVSTGTGCLYCDGKFTGEETGEFASGTRIGVLLDLNDGSILLFRNGVQHGPGYAAGSVTGPVVHAVQVSHGAARLHQGAAWPAGHTQ